MQGHRLGIFATHPIQYFAPLWRTLAAVPGLDLVVHFFSDHSIRGGLDPGFGMNVRWDVPILEGYEHRFLTCDADLARPNAVALPNAPALVKEGGFDSVMVHGYTHRFERQIIRAAKHAGRRTLLRGELTDVRPPGLGRIFTSLLRNLYLWWFYRQIDSFCYIGHDARDHLIRRGVPQERMFFSPYSVDFELFERQRSHLDRAQCRRRLGISEGQVVLLYSGKLIPRKDPLLILEALRHLGNPEDVALIIVGDGELRGCLEAAGRQLLGSRYIGAGFVNQSRLGEYFAAADLFVFPSLFETWGLVVNEAMQFALPVLATTNVRCHADLVIPGETGFTFSPGDVHGLARSIRRLVQDPPLRDKMGKTARSHIQQYTIKASADGICKALGLPLRHDGLN